MFALTYWMLLDPIVQRRVCSFIPKAGYVNYSLLTCMSHCIGEPGIVENCSCHLTETPWEFYSMSTKRNRTAHAIEARTWAWCWRRWIRIQWGGYIFCRFISNENDLRDPSHLTTRQFERVFFSTAWRVWATEYRLRFCREKLLCHHGNFLSWELWHDEYKESQPYKARLWRRTTDIMGT